mmetsp:Transcript_58775/g.116455  ORF Transcript_58775/g.116455 Transcript_58775/m.116455 type:complete len:201 (-) Transcript_58775:24-626(-)
MLEGGHAAFDIVSVQFTLQYLAESRDSLHALFARLSSLLRPGGRIIGAIPSCEVLGDLYTDACAKAGAASGDERVKGNSLYSVRFQQQALLPLLKSSSDSEDAFARCWGLPYAFSLVGAVDSQEEYVVPWEALEELTDSLGFKVILDAPFAELLQAYGVSSRFVADVFSKDKRNTPLNEEESELFQLYSCFVFERCEGQQ